MMPALSVLYVTWREALLAAAAMTAMLVFRVGMIPTLVACTAGGIALSQI